ncbi:MAG: response regulator [Bacteroidales bacterium]|nr:response regulator [Bacteroidales bacterium]
MKNITKVIMALLYLLFQPNDVNAGILTTKNGISSSLINDLYQTSDGCIWIASEDGLTRYDGSKCQTYKKNISDSTTIVDNYILTIFESSDKTMFVGTEHGLARYNSELDTFEKIPMFSVTGDVELLAYASGIVELNEETLYIATSGHGLFEYDKKTNKARQSNLKLGYYISKIYKDSKDNVWIATSDNGAFRISSNSYVYTVNTKGIGFSCFCEDDKGNIYASSLHDGLYIHNNNTETFELVSEPTKRLNIKTIKYFQGKIMMGTDGLGVFTFDPTTQTTARHKIASLPFDSNKTKVHSILIDENENIWLALFQKGVVVIPTDNNDFKYLGYKSGDNNYIGSNYISALMYTKDSILYVGTDNDGLYLIDYKKNDRKHFDKKSNCPSTIMCMSTDRSGNIWLGTYLEGIFILNKKTNEIKNIKQITSLPFPTEPISAICTDINNNIWIASMGGGLTRYTPSENKIYKYPTKGGLEYRENLDMLHNRWINCLYYSEKQNKLYIGTLDGLGCLDITSGSFTATMGRNRILGQCRINDITEDNEGNIWIASNLGLSMLSYNTHKVETLPDIIGTENIIKAINCDANGHLWASTRNGIIRIDPKTTNVSYFYEQDGIETSEFGYRSSYRSSDGQLFFGGTDGITFFTPGIISNKRQQPIIRLVDFYINGQRVLPSTLSGKYKVKSSTTEDSTLTYNLCHTDNTFTLEFTSSKMMPQKGMKFQYKLTNSDGESETIFANDNENNKITFRNMDPDTYTIRVVAFDNGDESTPLKLKVIIHPAIYATNTAKFIYFILACIIIYVLQKQIRIRQKTKQQLTETLHNQQMHAAKMNMFTNIAHEIRTPMSLVIAPLKELMATDTDPKHKANYEVIERNTQRILRLMAQVLDIQKIDAGKMKLHFCPTNVNKIVNDVCLTFDFEARAKNISLKYNNLLQEEPIVYVDPQHFDQIVTNLVSNAIKYTPKDGEVVIKTCIEGSNYILKVEDTGNGFSDEDMKHMFERFHRLSNSEIGFGIGLDLTNTIVQLHHGTIIPSNKVDEKGGIMTVSIPLGHTHLQDDEIEPAEETRTTASQEVSEQEETKKPKTNLRIVLVDDDPEIRNYIKSHLSDTYSIITCQDGREAQEEILTNVPDLVVTDVVMPNMDGFTLCRNIKHNININYLPVVILTARSAETDRIESYENGADAYIAKPFSIDELSATIKNLISQRQKFMANMVAQQQVLESIENIPASATLSYNEQLMQRITAAINANISDSEYSIEDLAREVGLSRVHLHRKMKEITNMTTRDYVRNVRLKYAETLLLSKKYDIQQIADMTGFSTPTYFAKAFKVFYGVSPKEYMNANDKNNEA